MSQAGTSFQSDPSIDRIRVPPNSVEAEQSVLGGLLLENSAWDRIGDLLREDDFYRADHRLIWRHIARMVEASRPADALTVAESLERSNDWRRSADSPTSRVFRRTRRRPRTSGATPRSSASAA
jgi:hypothetical protein